MLKEFFLSLLYPNHCPFCRTAVERQGQWCETCFAAYWRPTVLQLPRRLTCLDRCISITKYHGPMRRLLHQLKYEGKTGNSKACQYGLSHFRWKQYWGEIDCVVPVPLSPEKEKSRGFNQTELIFRPWADAYWPWADALQRVRETKSQWQLKKPDRAENIKRAFAVKGSFRVTQKHILLVDDIFTTGATLENCALALKENGAATVTGLVMASDAI